MPPDPVGRLERSRARPPPLTNLGARPVLARAPHALRASDAPRPRRPARALSRSASPSSLISGPSSARACSARAARFRCPQTPSAGSSALALGLPLFTHLGPVQCSRVLRTRCALPMPPDPVGQLERSRARPPPLLGARPVLGRCAPCALPMPPDPVGQLERSRARPPRQTLPGARPVLGRCAPCGPTPARLPPRAPDPVGQLERSRARPPLVLVAGMLARCARCGPTPARLPPRAPDQRPRGSRRALLERSRARVPLAVGILQPPPAFPLTR